MVDRKTGRTDTARICAVGCGVGSRVDRLGETVEMLVNVAQVRG